MWYRYALLVETDDTKMAPARKEIELPEGVVTGVRVRFPPGSRGQVYTAVFQGTHKMWPRGEGNYAWGDNESIDMDEHVRNITGWHYFLEGYAVNCRYDHTVWWDFNVLEKEYAETWGPIQELVRLLKDLIGL